MTPPNDLLKKANRAIFLDFAEKVFRRAAKRNATLDPPSTSATEVLPTPSEPARAEDPKDLAVAKFLALGEVGKAGINIKPVALFMADGSERIGIGFCHTNSKTRVTISPGLAALMNGSTSKPTLRRKAYFDMPEVTLAGVPCRLVRTRNKTVALIEWGRESPFAQASRMLTSMGEARGHDDQVRVLSVDAMAIEYAKGEVADLLGCIDASKHLEVVVYANRGDNLDFLKAKRHDAQSPPNILGLPSQSTSAMSGTERLQNKTDAEKRAREDQTIRGQSGEPATESFVRGVETALRSILGKAPKPPRPQKAKPAPRTVIQQRTKAEMGKVDEPEYIPITKPKDHITNAFLEFVALTKASAKLNLVNCKTIMQTYRETLEGRPSATLQSTLAKLLEEHEAAIYDNERSEVIAGQMRDQYMAAYSWSGGFVDRRESDRSRDHQDNIFVTPPGDPIVVVAQCTRIMLDGRILQTASEFAEDVTKAWEDWETPKFTWVNGVPGCGKTTWVVNAFNADEDIVVTATTEALEDLREKLAHRVGDKVKTKVRTMASILVNGVKEADRCHRLTVDEALMSHFGAIVLASRLAGAKEVVLIGDINQLPYIDREQLFEVRYSRPTMVINIHQELLCTHRNPMDVAYALREVYPGIYSSSPIVKSLELRRLQDAHTTRTNPATLFLVHTQEEKLALTTEGYGTGEGSRVLTIHEAQGLKAETVLIIKRKRPIRLHDSVAHAVVAVSRHTNICAYYADETDDAIGRFVTRAYQASEREVFGTNLMCAIASRDDAVINKMKTISRV